MEIRKAQPSDAPAILEIILPVIREAATYTLDPDMSEAEALAACVSNRWHTPESVVTGRCSSTSSSARTSALYDCGSHWGLKSWDVFPALFDIHRMAMSMHS